MKKEYKAPKAEMYVFDYKENVVASLGNDKEINPNANEHAHNSCYTHNGSDVVDHGCTGIPKSGYGL